MRKGKSLIGKDVLALDDGTKLEKVHGVVIDPGGQRLLALVVDEGGLMSSTKVVPIEQVSSFGRDAVVVGGQGSIITTCLLYTSPSPRDRQKSRMPSSA